MTNRTSELVQLRARAAHALHRTTRGAEREFWNGVMVSLRWGKLRLRDLNTAVDRAVTRAEYRAGRSAEAAASGFSAAAIGPKNNGANNGASNGGGRPAEPAGGLASPAL